MFLSKYYHVDLVSNKQFDIRELEKYFSVKLNNVSKLVVPGFSGHDTYGYDLFVNSTHHSNMACNANKSIYLLSFPHRHVSCDVIRSYDLILANSNFTKNFTHKYWGVEDNVKVLYPASNSVDLGDQFRRNISDVKENIILSVGRFFVEGHNKKQLEMVLAYIDMVDGNHIPGWSLVLIGSINRKNESDVKYFSELQRLSEGYNITIISDCDNETLISYYRRSSIYWHLAGLGVLDPECMEHFGMAVVEAMSYGCVPVVFNGGGLPEVLGDNLRENLVDDISGLRDTTINLIRNGKSFLLLQSLKAMDRSNMFSLKSHDCEVSRILDVKCLG